MKRIFDVHPWEIKASAFDLQNKRLQESITSIGNGYMGMRGNYEEGFSGDTHMGTYLAGIWYPDKTRVGWWKIGYPDYFGKVINAPSFIPIGIYVNQHKVDIATDKIQGFNISLNMSEGILRRSYIWENEDVKVRFSFKRFVSVVQKELAVIHVHAEMLSGSAEIRFVPSIDGDIVNEDSNYEEKFWEECQREVGLQSYLTTQTIENPFGIERFTVTTMMQNISEESRQQEFAEKYLYVEENITHHLDEGSSASLTKLVSVVTSRDVTLEQQVEKSQAVLKIAVEKGLNQLETEHIAVWNNRWSKADVHIEGDEESQQGVRFNIFQLFSTYYGEDSRLNIGPKGFTGEKYGGATYWDTEAFILPMYLSTADKEITEQLLEYRYNQLPGAYTNAQKQGLKGALYPMVTFNGIESHNEWEITFEEIHRNSSIAYAIYNYTNYTGDETFLKEKGIDVLVGIARFWADRVHFSKRNQKYMLHGVTGPNEYENNINNNWYTNKMAAWELSYTLESLTKVSKTKTAEIKVTEKEKAHWLDIIDRMYFPYDEKLGIFVQHDTFLDKDLRTVGTLTPEDKPLNQNWSWDKILRSPFIKQADVLQGIYYLNDKFTLEEKETNFNFYEPMTVHESSLSASIHSILAAELGKYDKAVDLYARTARLDLDNYNNDTEDGLHITSMSGGWLAIVQGFAGMRTNNGLLSFKPFCPDKWTKYSFFIKYRERLLDIQVDPSNVSVNLVEGEPLKIKLYDQSVMLTSRVVVQMQSINE